MAKPQCGHLRLLYATSRLSIYEGRMIARDSQCRPLLRPATVMALLLFGIGLGGCADMSDNLTVAFADPAKYELYECKQLEAERKNLALRAAELQGLMAKAETGVAGSAVVELAYRSEYVSLRGQTKFADEAWQRNKCQASAPTAAAPAASSPPPANVRGARPPVRSGGTVQ
jgi:hypothetical protein